MSQSINSQSVDEVNNQYHEELLKNQEIEKLDDPVSESNEAYFSNETSNPPEKEQDNQNDLREFGVDTNEPDLFNSDNKPSNSENLLGSSEEETEDDDLEIPAFLRRQKN